MWQLSFPSKDKWRLEMNLKHRYIFLIFSVILTGCSTTDSAVFVTKTSIAVIDVDSTPGNVSFAYDRIEGFFGPNYKNGAVPSVVGAMKTDGEIINPTIKQLYATGKAATLVVDPEALNYEDEGEDKLMGKRKALIFATSTSLGFKIGISTSNPTFTLGYKRKEASYIPIHKGDGENGDKYSSVLASIDTTIKTNAEEKTFENGQFFATGKAAKLLAIQPYIKEAFKNSAKSALDPYDTNFSSQVEIHSNLTRCSFNLNEAEWKEVINKGVTEDLFSDLDEALMMSLNKYTKSKSSDDLLSLLRLYSEAIAGGIDPADDYTKRLKSHENLVCNLARA